MGSREVFLRIAFLLFKRMKEVVFSFKIEEAGVFLKATRENSVKRKI